MQIDLFFFRQKQPKSNTFINLTRLTSMGYQIRRSKDLVIIHNNIIKKQEKGEKLWKYFWRDICKEFHPNLVLSSPMKLNDKKALKYNIIAIVRRCCSWGMKYTPILLLFVDILFWKLMITWSINLKAMHRI